jgi:hypothetical protein
MSRARCRTRAPPRETWTQEQRDAADRLGEILLPHLYQEALRVILAEIERGFHIANLG